MPYVLVRHKVEDYARWKPLFEQHAPTRQASGSQGGWIFRVADDPNELIVLLRWDDLDRAREFARSDNLRETMQRAGVADRPDVYFLEEADTPSV